MDYRRNRVEKFQTELEDETRINQQLVSTTMTNLRQLIDQQETNLLEQIQTNQFNQTKSIEQFNKNLQHEQQNLIQQILNIMTIKTNQQPKQLLEAKLNFQNYLTDTNQKLVELKPLTRKKQTIFGIEQIKQLQTTIQNVKLIEQTNEQNQKLKDFIQNNSDKSKLSLINWQLKDLDMEIIANELAINKVSLLFIFSIFHFLFLSNS